MWGQDLDEPLLAIKNIPIKDETLSVLGANQKTIKYDEKSLLFAICRRHLCHYSGTDTDQRWHPVPAVHAEGRLDGLQRPQQHLFPGRLA